MIQPVGMFAFTRSAGSLAIGDIIGVEHYVIGVRSPPPRHHSIICTGTINHYSMEANCAATDCAFFSPTIRMAA